MPPSNQRVGLGSTVDVAPLGHMTLPLHCACGRPAPGSSPRSCTCWWPISWNTGLQPATRDLSGYGCKRESTERLCEVTKLPSRMEEVGSGEAGGTGHRRGSESAPPLPLMFSLFIYLFFSLFLSFLFHSANNPESW